MGLRRNVLGLHWIVFLVLSAAAPLVVIAGGVPVAMLLGNGAGLPACFGLAMLILLVFAVGYTEMAHHVRNAGAFYAFAARGLGGMAGGATATIALASYVAMLMGLYGLFGSALSEAIGTTLHVRIAWGPCALGGLAAVSLLGYRQVDLSARILALLVGCEYLIVLYLDLRVLLAAGDSGISTVSFTPAAFTAGSPWIALLLSFSAFVGFEATTIYSEEARDPARTVPLATYLSVIVLGLFYMLSSWCVVVAVGAGKLLPTMGALEAPTALLFSISDRYAGPIATLLMRGLFVTSVFAGLLAFHNAVSRYGFALGREGLLPGPLAATHPRHKSPHVASSAQSALLAGLLGTAIIASADPVLTLFGTMSGIGTLGVLVLMTIASAAVIGFFARRRDTGIAPWRRRLGPGLAAAALLAVCGLACLHFDALSGTTGALAWLAPLVVPAAGGAGLVLAARLRHRAPERFQALGENAR